MAVTIGIPFFGSKRRLAAVYPEPRYDTVVEPFAGGAGYSSYYAASLAKVVLVDKDQAVVDLWNRLCGMSVADLDDIVCPPVGHRTDEYLIAAGAGGEQGQAVLHGHTRQVTAWMYRDWESKVKPAVARLLPHLHKWEVVLGDYHDVPAYEATWFVDAPYQYSPSPYTNGEYNALSDYSDLSHWCTQRKGHVIVAEQAPADWLPFRTLTFAMNGVGRGVRSMRHELVWTNA